MNLTKRLRKTWWWKRESGEMDGAGFAGIRVPRQANTMLSTLVIYRRLSGYKVSKPTYAYKEQNVAYTTPNKRPLPRIRWRLRFLGRRNFFLLWRGLRVDKRLRSFPCMPRCQIRRLQVDLIVSVRRCLKYRTVLVRHEFGRL